MQLKKLLVIFSLIFLLIIFISIFIVSANSKNVLNKKYTIKKICERYSYENCPDGCIKLKEPSCQFPCTVLQNGKIKCRKIPGCNGDGPICVSPNSKRVFSLKQNIIFSSLLLKII